MQQDRSTDDAARTDVADAAGAEGADVARRQPEPPGLAQALAGLVAARPELRGAPVAVLGSGLDHHAYRVGDLVLRLRGDDADEDLTREAALLDVVRRRCPVAVPAPVAGAPDWIAYPLLDGVPLLALDPALRDRHAPAVAETLGAVLAGLWATPADEVAALVEDDAAPLEEWRDEASELTSELAPELPERARAGVERFLAAALPADAPVRVFSHNDLGIEHVLVDPERGAVQGVIDWSDAALVDPAKDLGLVLRDLGDEAFERARRAAVASLAAPDEGLAARARVYAHCLALEDLAFGLETGQARYAEAARAALIRLACASR